MDKNIKFKIASNWFKILQEIICYEIIKLEGKNKSFEIKKWKRSKKLDEGGGESRILRNGKIFDKVGVNFSKVYGKLSNAFMEKIPGGKKDHHSGPLEFRLLCI